MKHLIRSGVVVCVALSVQSTVVAAEIETSSNVTLVSDYIFRGISQTNEDPAIQGGIDLTSNAGWYAGVWGSNIGFGDGSLEADIYGGWRYISDASWSFDVGAIRYIYPGGNNADSEFNYNEVYTHLSYQDATLSVVYSDDYFGAGVNQFVYVAVSYSYPIAEQLSLELSTGFNKFESGAELTRFLGGEPTSDDSYWDGSLGINYQLSDKLSVNLTYIATDISDSACSDVCDNRLVFGVRSSF